MTSPPCLSLYTGKFCGPGDRQRRCSQLRHHPSPPHSRPWVRVGSWQLPGAPAASGVAQSAECFINILCLPACRNPRMGGREEEEGGSLFRLCCGAGSSVKETIPGSPLAGALCDSLLCHGPRCWLGRTGEERGSQAWLCLLWWGCEPSLDGGRARLASWLTLQIPVCTGALLLAESGHRDGDLTLRAMLYPEVRDAQPPWPPCCPHIHTHSLSTRRGTTPLASSVLPTQMELERRGDGEVEVEKTG